MGYPMNYSRVVSRNTLHGDYDPKAQERNLEFDPRPILRGDLRRLERDQRDAEHIAAYAKRAGIAPEQATQVLDDFFGGIDVLFAAQLETANSAGGFVSVPKDPPRELLISMALRINHGFGMDDERSQEVQISDMRKVYEEVVGAGFYSEEVKGRYSALDRAASHGPDIVMVQRDRLKQWDSWLEVRGKNSVNPPLLTDAIRNEIAALLDRKVEPNRTDVTALALLFNVFSMGAQERDSEWEYQWRQLMQEIELELTAAGYKTTEHGGNGESFASAREEGKK